MVVKAPHFVHMSTEATGRVVVVVNLGTITRCVTRTIYNVKWEECRKVTQVTRFISMTHLLSI